MAIPYGRLGRRWLIEVMVVISGGVINGCGAREEMKVVNDSVIDSER